MTERTRYAKGEKRSPRGMNKLEADYGILLEARKRLGEILDYRYERLTLKLADDTRYTPDYMVMAADCVIECHECKGGFEREDARIKRKMAADQFPFRFYLCKKADGGGWTVDLF